MTDNPVQDNGVLSPELVQLLGGMVEGIHISFKHF